MIRPRSPQGGWWWLPAPVHMAVGKEGSGEGGGLLWESKGQAGQR